MDSELPTLLARMHHVSLNTIELGLERVENFLALLGSPHKNLPPVIHVAGTNGKGSLIAYLEAIFTTAGYKVHRYISPHLVRFNERIQLNGKLIDDDYLKDVLQRVAKCIDQQPVTFFESTTTAAFLAFSEQPADIVLLETGMGGRLDATNVIEKPLLTAITPISLDHCDFLGNTIAAIAAEKAGIIKTHVPCVVGRQSSEAMHVINQKAAELQSALYRYGHEWQVLQDAYQSPARTLHFKPSLAGRHQYDNAATAIACIEQLPQFAISDMQITQALSQTTWPARLQRLENGPLPCILPPGIELWLDGGHNPQGGEILAQWLIERNIKDIHLICGMVKGKDSAAFLKTLAPQVNKLYAITIDGEPQSQSAQQLQQTAQEVGIDAVSSPNLENALQTIAHHAKTPSIVCICGSLYLAGRVLAANEEK